jgi:serine/threonine protein kinase
VNEGRILKLTDFFCDNFTNRGRTHLSKYLAPEIAAGETGDERSDIFSLGVILGETLAANGRIQNSRLKNEWEELIGKASHSEPAMRFQKLEELLAALRRIQAAGLSQASDE